MLQENRQPDSWLMKGIKCSEQSPESEKALFQELGLLDQVVEYRDDVGGLKFSLKSPFHNVSV